MINHRNFLLLLQGSGLAGLGYFCFSITSMLWLADVADSASLVGLVILVGGITTAAFISLGGVVDGAARLTYTTALRRFRQGLAHAFGGDKDAASQCGLRGLRAGGVCDALMRGVPASAIKAQGHWALDSNVMEKHARFSTQQRMRFF